MPRPKIAKVIQFIVGVGAGQYATIQDANTAAAAHRDALSTAGDTWAIPGDPGDTPPGSGPIDAIDGSNAAVYIGINYDAATGAITPANVTDPAGTARVNYHWDEYHQPPSP
jgi:hypothetical protein